MNYSIKPSEKDIRESRQIVKGVVETCRIVSEVPDLSVELGWTGDEYILNELGGAEAFAKSSQVLKVGFNTSVNNWQDRLEFSASIGYGKCVFLNLRSSRPNDLSLVWEKVLYEGFSLVFANEALGNIEEKVPWEMELDDEEEEKIWRAFSDNFDKGLNSDELPEEVFEGRNIEIIGYKLSRELIKSYELEELPELEMIRLVEAGERLYI